MSKHPYLEPKGLLRRGECDWCGDKNVPCQPLWHGDLDIMDLCGKCMATHVYHIGETMRWWEEKVLGE